MIWNRCIKRPVFTTVIFLVLVIFGIYGYFDLPIRNFPDIEFPVVNVNVILPGAEPEVVETEIVEPLEEEINTIEGLEELQSTASEQRGSVTAEFELERDIDVAAQDVRDAVERARRDLPADAEAPIVRKMDMDARPIVWITLTGDERWDPIDLSTYADENIVERLEPLSGVGRVMIGGEQRYAVRLELDHEKMAAHRVTVHDVVQTIQANNLDIPAGRVESERREFTVKTLGRFDEPEPLNDLIIDHRDGQPVRIGDVGQARDGVESDRQIARFNSEQAVGLGIVQQSGANTVEVADLVRERMEEIEEDLPAGLEYEIASDQSRFIRESIFDLQISILLATILVFFVIMFFLRSLGATVITTIAIPSSLAVGLALIYFFGFSMNVITLLALILVIGIVVDDAVVILESSYRHLEEGANARAAARVGTTEVAFAAIANTLSLGAVFIPVALTRGLIGRIFYQFGITVAVTVFASTFTALTLTPMLCSRFLAHSESRSRLSIGIDKFLDLLAIGYEKLLDWSLAYRWLVVLLAIGAMLLGIYFFSGLSTEFQPDIDAAEFAISFETPQGATLPETERFASKIEDYLQTLPEVNHVFMAIGLGMGGGGGEVNRGMIMVDLVAPEDREDHQQVIMDQVRRKIEEFPDGRGFTIQLGGPGGGEAPLQMAIQHDDLDELDEQREAIVEWMREQEEFVGVDYDLSMDLPQVEVEFNRELAASHGITISEISQTMRYLLSQTDITEIERAHQRYEVIPETHERGRSVPVLLEDFYIRSPEGEMISLSNLVHTEETVGPSEIARFNRRRAVTISASTPPGVAMGDANRKLQEHLAETLPPGFTFESTGEADMMEESFQYLTESLLLGIIFVYLVMAAQFESFLHPLTIMMTLPLAAVGAFGLLYLFDMTFNVFSFIGIIMLVGLVTKNGILLVDYTNVLRARGHDLFAAAAEAGRVRFRPVLMTAASTILGMMPIALGYGMGGEARAPMGWAVAGGMFSSTVLTLVVIPVVYTLFSQISNVCSRNCWKLFSFVFAMLTLVLALWSAYFAVYYTTGAEMILMLVFALLLLVFDILLIGRQSFARLYQLIFVLFFFIGGLIWFFPEIAGTIFIKIDPVYSGVILALYGFLGALFLYPPGVRCMLGGEE